MGLMDADSKVLHICSVCECRNRICQHNAPSTNNTSVEYISMLTFEVCEVKETVCALYQYASMK